MRRLRVRTRFLLGLLVALVLLGSAELVLVLLDFAPLEIYARRARIDWSVDKNLDNKEVTDPHAGYTFTISTDENGLRRTGLDRSGAARRVLVLGDSVVFGWNVSGAEAMPARLQVHLDRLAGEGAAQVINGGQPSFSSLQSMKMLQVIAPIYKPHVVLFQLSDHDTFPTRTSDLQQLNPGLSLADLDSVLARSRLLWLLRDISLTLMGRAWHGGERRKVVLPEDQSHKLVKDFKGAHKAALDYDNGIRVTTSELAWIRGVMNKLAARHGFVLIWTSWLKSKPPPPYARVLGLVGGGKPEHFIPQRLPATGEVNQDELILSRDAGHMNPSGCDYVGEILARGLVDRGLIPARKTGPGGAPDR